MQAEKGELSDDEPAMEMGEEVRATAMLCDTCLHPQSDVCHLSITRCYVHMGLSCVFRSCRAEESRFMS